MRRSWSPTARSRWRACGIDYLAFSAHKAYAPFGTGVLVARKGLLDFSPAEMELIRSSGEENVGGIAALGKALVLLQRIGLDVIQEEEQALTARALLGMARVPGLKIYGIANPESPTFAHKGGVIPFDLKGVISHTVARELAARGGIGVRSGCHCAHLTVKRMLGVPPWAERLQGVILTVLRRLELPGVVRVSLGIENSEEDVDTLIRVLGGIARQPKGGSPEKNVKQLLDECAQAAFQTSLLLTDDAKIASKVNWGTTAGSSLAAGGIAGPPGSSIRCGSGESSRPWSRVAPRAPARG